MKVQKWKDIRRTASIDKEAASRAWIEHQLLEMSLREIRELAGKTQVEMAEAIEIAQGELSRLERRDDHLVSTLRRYVEALGGELEVTARFGDRTIRLHGV